MPRKPRGGAGRRGGGRGPRKAAIGVAVAALAVAVGFLGGYLYNDLRGPGRARARLEAVLGTLDAAGNRVQVATREAGDALWAKVEETARELGDRVRISELRRSAGGLRALLGVEGGSYPFEIRWPEPAAAPRLALVIDDLGRDLEAARDFLDLAVPVTLAVLPHQPRSREIAALAGARGREYLLHLPMQPQGYPKVDPGEGALLEGMGHKELARRVSAALDSVPGASGVNNHMGSRLTELREPMLWVMGELRGRGLYFLDSLTSGASVAAAAARDEGVRWTVRDVFLDNTQEVNEVGAQLDRALEAARAHGRALAIGHPHPATLEALRRWAPKIRAAGVEVVAPSALLRGREGA